MSYLIKDTTREQRQSYADKALAISLLDAGEPSQDVQELVQKYINGEIELEEIKSSIISKYK